LLFIKEEFVDTKGVIKINENKKEFAIASTFLRGKYKMRNVCRRFHIHHLYCVLNK
jgi:hypothetical protein